MRNSKIAIFVFVFVFIFSFTSSIPDKDVFEWGNNVQEWLIQVMNDEVDVSRIQSVYDEANFEIKNYDGSKLVSQVAKELSSMFEAKEKAVMSGIEHAKSIYKDFRDLNSSLNIPEGTFFADDIETKPTDLLFSRDFMTKIADYKSSVKIPNEADRSKIAFNRSLVWTQDLESKWQELFQNDTELRWQYFGSESGVFRIFPGHEWARTFVGFPENFDHRFRPWYLSASSGPKRVVIIVDASFSMHGHRWMTAKSTASRILNSLTQNDYFSLLVINNGTRGDRTRFEVASCDTNRLIQATGTHRRQALGTLDYIYPNGIGDPYEAFNKSLELLNKPPAERCLPVIAFLTDGENRDQDTCCAYTKNGCILCEFSTEKTIDMVNSKISEMTPQPRIFTFHINNEDGGYPGDSDSHLPHRLACDTGGILTRMNNKKSLRDQLKPYLGYFTKAQKSEKLIWTSPYLGASGLGVLITAAIPLFDELKDDTPLIGVAGVDFVLARVEELVRSFQWGNAYAFMISDAGEAIIHPRVKRFENSDGPPFFMDISVLETKNGYPEEFKEVREAMVKGRTGSKTLEVFRERKQGGDYSGMREELVKQTYYYTKVENTPFSLAFVLEDPDDKHHKVLKEPKSLNFTSYYHRLDLIYKQPSLNYLNNSLNVLKHPEEYPYTYISNEHSTVKLSPKAFCNAFSYVKSIENATSVEEMQTVINMHRNENSGCDEGDEYRNSNYTELPQVRAGVRTDIKLSQIAENVWKTTTDDRIVWRYLGTHRGVFRIYPGTPNNKTFEPAERVWYERSLANKDKFTISTPYLDANGAGIIITASRAIPELSHHDPGPGCSGEPGCPCEEGSECNSGVCHPLNNTCSNGNVQSVVGVDFKYNQFDKEFYKLTGCGDIQNVRCYLMDQHGLLAWAPQFRDVPYPPPFDQPSRFYSFKNTFIGRREPGLARDLLMNKQFLERVTRVELQSICDTSSPQYIRSLRVRSTLNSGTFEENEDENGSDENEEAEKKMNKYNNIHNFKKQINKKWRQLSTQFLNTSRLIGWVISSLFSSFHFQEKNSIEIKSNNTEKIYHNTNNDVEIYDTRDNRISSNNNVNENYWDQPVWIIDPTIAPYNNKTTCPHRIIYYETNDTVIPEDSGILKGNFSDACSEGDYKITPLKNTNLYLIVIENFEEKDSNFQCSYVSSALYDIGKYYISSVCDVSTGGNHEGGYSASCPDFDRDVTLKCSASSISIFSALLTFFIQILFLI
eukprot:gb/GECH01007068.1/.p1 GENE.gb/GECH01007068.1/~~gb/GECH01007068.1/.p1  ORF type:complete len:1244 (+),score=261.99 gb/GECH01007068.1/:1-3732(+)